MKLHPTTWVKVLLYLFADKIDSWYPAAYITQSLLSTATYIVKYFVKIQDLKNALFIQSRSTFYNVWDIIIQAKPVEQQINNVILFQTVIS